MASQLYRTKGFPAIATTIKICSELTDDLISFILLTEKGTKKPEF